MIAIQMMMIADNEDIVKDTEVETLTNKVDDIVADLDEENEYEEIEEIQEIKDGNSIVDEVTDTILNKILINIQSNEEPNESLILEGSNQINRS